MIIGQNLNDTASQLIPEEKITFYKWKSRVLNEIGNWVNEFEDALEIHATISAIPWVQMSQMGLDMERKHWLMWTSTDILDLSRGRSTDQIEYLGYRCKLSNEEDWSVLNGWNQVLVTQLFENESRLYFGFDPAGANFSNSNFIG